MTTMYHLANSGFDVIAPDLYLHGDRPESSRRLELLETAFLFTMRNIIYETAADIPIVCQELGIDMATSGMVGISGGGLVAHAMAIQKPQFKALAAVITSPNWLKADPSRQISPFSPEGMILSPISPSSHPNSYPPLALCMLNSDVDDLISCTGSVELYEKLGPIYARQQIRDRLMLKIYNGAGHQFTDEMLADTIAWLKKWLVD